MRNFSRLIRGLAVVGAPVVLLNVSNSERRTPSSHYVPLRFLKLHSLPDRPHMYNISPQESLNSQHLHILLPSKPIKSQSQDAKTCPKNTFLFLW